MTIKINKAKVSYFPEHSTLKLFVNAQYDDQLPITLKELGRGVEDEYTIEYELPNQTLIVLWK